MNLEKLEKLNELRENGILTQEEFDKQKDILIHNTTDHQSNSKKNKGGWEYIGTSFLISSIFTLIVACISYGIYGDKDEAIVFDRVIIHFVSAVIMSILLSTVKSEKYENCPSPLGIFFIVLIFGSLGIWGSLFHFLRIKHGVAVLKEDRK